MTEACVFCEILAGRAAASVVYEDELTLAFMDLSQVNAGHVLVVPKRHVETLFELNAQTGAALMAVLPVVARAIRRAFPSDGLSVWQSNGPGANQEVPHVHFHLVPRRVADGLLQVYPAPAKNAGRTELDRQAGLIREALLT